MKLIASSDVIYYNGIGFSKNRTVFIVYFAITMGQLEQMRYTCYIHTIVYLYIYMEKRKANPKGTLTRIREQFNNHNAWLLIVHF